MVDSANFNCTASVSAGDSEQPWREADEALRTRSAEAERDAPPSVIITSHGFRPWELVLELWEFRELLYLLAWRDLKVRYKQTVLGAAWAVLQPLVFMAIFTLVLGRAGQNGEAAYPVFVYSGLVLWGLFAGGLGSAANSLVESERLITKVYFPRILIPIATLGPALADFCIAACLLAVLMAWWGLLPTASWLLVPLPLAVTVALTVGAGSLLSALNVKYRDFRYTVSFLLQAGMFATPAIYAQDLAFNSPGTGTFPPDWFVLANPLNGCVLFFRACLFGQPLPWSMLGMSAVYAVALLALGLTYFRLTEDSFADVI